MGKPIRWKAAIVGLAGFLLFLVSVGSTMATGGLIADARGVFQTSVRDRDRTLQSLIKEICEQDESDDLGGLCAGDVEEGEEEEEDSSTFEECRNSLAPRGASNAFSDFDLACSVNWQAALEAADKARSKAYATSNWADWIPSQLRWFFGLLISSEIADGGDVSIFHLYIFAMIGLTLLFVALGIGVSGRWYGVLLSKQNRISLSLIQVIAWTIVLMAAYTIYAAFNIGLMGEASTRAGTDANQLYPVFQAWSWAVMGIAIASPMASSLIKGRKESAPPDDRTARVFSTFDLQLKPLESNRDPGDASIADIFLGEDQDDHTRLDITRAQHVIITALLLFTYAGWISIAVDGFTPEQLLGAFPQALPVLAQFPDPGATFTGLLLLTHGTYIAGKWQTVDKGLSENG